MKKKILNNFIIIIIVSLLSLLFSFLLNNYNLLFLSREERVIKDITNYIVEYDGLEKKNDKYISLNSDEKNIKITYEGYINKLIINYNTDINFDTKIIYNGTDSYNKKINKNIDDILNYRLNKSFVVIKDNVKDIELNLNNGNNFSIESIKIDNILSFNIYTFIFMFISMISIFIIYKYYKHNLFNGKIEYLFLVITLLFGTLIIILQPKTTSYSWDDQIHFTESYRIFELDGITEWTEATSVMSEVEPFKNVDTLEERKLQNNYLNTSNNVIKTESNSPLIQRNQIGYLLPGLVLKLSSVFNIPFAVSFNIAKFSILLSYSLLMFYAIKIIPRGKRLLSFVGLFPSIIFLATQFSYDPPIIGGIALFVAVFLDIIENNRKIDLFTALILLISLIIANFIKAVYIPLILLILFIPRDRFENNKQNNVFKTGAILIFLLLVFTFVFPTVTQTSSLGDLRGGNTSTSGQLKMILNNPLSYVKVLDDTAGVQFMDKLIGPKTVYNYSYINIYNNNLYYLIIITLVFLVVTDSYTKNCNKYLKWFTLLLILGIILLIWTALYLSFTPVGELTINGVQNRYFIPLLFPLFLICLSNNNIKNNFNILKYDTIIFIIISLIYIYSIYETYLIVFCK